MDAFRENTAGGGTALPDKTLRFCSSARETQLPVFPLPKRSALQTEGAPQLPVTADLPVGSEPKTRFLCGLCVPISYQPARNSALRITNYEFLLMIAPLSAEDTI